MNEYAIIYSTEINNTILLYPILLGGGKNIGPPASAKVSCLGAKKLEKQHSFHDFT